MVDNYKVVCCTAAGRRRYMQYLIPYIVTCENVDRYDIWVNTNDNQDIEFFIRLSRLYPKINLVYQPDGIVNGIASINAFYKKCIEEDTIYFKLDDDIIWMEPQLIPKMVKFRIENPDYFLVSPLVINNAICTYILQNTGKIKLKQYVSANCNHRLTWRKGTFAAQLHEWFLKYQLPDEQYRDLYSGKKPIAMNRFSINAVLWFGKTMKAFNGIVTGDDEEYLSVIKPTEIGAVNCINSDAVLSHFAFYKQRPILDRIEILEKYGKELDRQWKADDKMKDIHSAIQQTMRYIDENQQEIAGRPLKYKTIHKPLSLKKRIKALYASALTYLFVKTTSRNIELTDIIIK